MTRDVTSLIDAAPGPHRRPGTAVALLLALLLYPTAGRAKVEIDAVAAAQAMGTSNVFGDLSKEWDFALRPTAELEVGFADYWSIGYGGKLNGYVRHPELISHQHELFLYANPAWGKNGANELVFEAGVETLRNSSDFATLNLIRPVFVAKALLEPRPWLRWQLGTNLSYRYFYDDDLSSSLDAMVEGRLGVTLPSRTTFIPHVAYGVRRFLQRDTGIDDDLDQQIDAGVRIGQALWTNAGLQLIYGYRLAIGDSGLLQRKISQDQFQYLGDDFLYSGHRGQIGFKQVVATGVILSLSGAVEQRNFAGWPAIDEQGAATGEDRHDLRFIPEAGIRCVWRFEDRSWPQGVELNAHYARIFQQSTSAWYETTIDIGVVDVTIPF